MITKNQCSSRFKEMFDKYQDVAELTCNCIKDEICSYLESFTVVMCRVFVRDYELFLCLDNKEVAIKKWSHEFSPLNVRLLSRALQREFGAKLFEDFCCTREEFLSAHEDNIGNNSNKQVSMYRDAANDICLQIRKEITDKLVSSSSVYCSLYFVDEELHATVSCYNQYAGIHCLNQWSFGKNDTAKAVLEKVLMQEFGVCLGETFTCTLNDVLDSIDPIIAEVQKNEAEKVDEQDALKREAYAICEYAKARIVSDTVTKDCTFKIYVDDQGYLIVSNLSGGFSYKLTRLVWNVREIFEDVFNSYFGVKFNDLFFVDKGGKIRIVKF